MRMIAQRRRFTVAVASMATAAATIALAPAASAADEWGAIAYSGNGSWGRAWDYPTSAAAQATAVNSCGYRDCKALTTFTGCGAVAYNGKAYQGGHGETLSAAMNSAISQLGGGYIDTWACN
jgi:Domain of unknown function (DUF4189)